MLTVRVGSLPRGPPQGPGPWPLPPADLGNVGLGGQANHDVQLLQLHIDGVVVLHEEDLHLVLEDLRPGGRAGLPKEQKASHQPCAKTPSTFAGALLGSEVEADTREGRHHHGCPLLGRRPTDWPLCV